MLDVSFSSPAAKFLEKIDLPLARRLGKHIEALAAKPFPKGTKRVENSWFDNEKVFRIRVGDYRVLYSVNYGQNRIMIVTIDKRSRVYD